jgi:hypothetical protein
MESGILCLLSKGVIIVSNWTHYDGGDIVILHPGAGNEVALFSLSVRACSGASGLLSFEIYPHLQVNFLILS